MTWLVVSVSTAGAAASLRLRVWRKLRSLGALYLQQSVCLLAFTDPAEEQVVITGLNAASAALDAETSGPAPAAGRSRSGLRAVDGP